MRDIIRWVVRRLLDLVAKVDVIGFENVPPTGAYVIATNHLGLVDAMLAYYAIDRWDLFVPTAEKRQEIWFFRWLGKYLNFVFIDRFNPDPKAMRTILGLMEKGYILVIAPEGTRSPVGSMQEGKPGVSYLAAKLNRPIVPVGLNGTEDKVILDNLKHLRRSHITIRAGKAFTLPPLPKHDRDEALKADTNEIMCRIAAQLDPKYRGVYADQARLKELLGNPQA